MYENDQSEFEACKLSLLDVILLLPIYCSSLGLSPLETTGMFSVYSLFVLLSKLVSGRLCDHEKIGRKKVFLTGLVLTACSYALLAFSRELVWLYLSQMIDGIATALLSVSLYTMVVDESGEEIAVNRGKQSAAQNFGGLYGMIFYFALLSNMDFFATWKVFFLGSAVLTLYGVWNAVRKLEDNMPKETDGKKLQNLKLAICLKAKGLIAVRFLLSLSLNVLGAVFVLIMMQRFGNNMMMIGLICLIPSTLLAYRSPSIGAKNKTFWRKKVVFNSKYSGNSAFNLDVGKHGTCSLWTGLVGIFLCCHSYESFDGCSLFQADTGEGARNVQRHLFVQCKSGKHDCIGIGWIFHAGDWRINAILSDRCFANLNHVGFPKKFF